MPSISDMIAIIAGLAGLVVAIWNAYTSRKTAEGNLAEIYQKIAGVDAQAFLDLKREVEQLKITRKFRGSFDIEVDADGVRLGPISAYPLESPTRRLKGSKT